MYFIIIRYSSLDDFLSINRMLYKGKNKVCCIIICYCELKLKKDKRPIKQLKKDIQVKQQLFMV